MFTTPSNRVAAAITSTALLYGTVKLCLYAAPTLHALLGYHLLAKFGL